MGMNEDLAQLYGTPGAQDQELQKQAEVELFCKIAADNDIDLNQLSDKQVNLLWSQAMGKTAEEEEEKKDEKEEDEEEEEKESAAREHAVKVAAAQEEQRADELGRKMAHSYVDELNKIASGAQEVETDKEAAMPPALAKALGRVRGAAGGAVAKGKDYGGRAMDAAGSAASKGREFGGKAVGAAKAHKIPIAAGAGGLAVGGGAGYAAGRKKEGSAIDRLALEEAVKIAADSGLDPELAADRVSSIFTLGLEESDKLASTVPEQINIRALEYLEAAGYPVEWS